MGCVSRWPQRWADSPGRSSRTVGNTVSGWNGIGGAAPDSAAQRSVHTAQFTAVIWTSEPRGRSGERQDGGHGNHLESHRVETSRTQRSRRGAQGQRARHTHSNRKWPSDLLDT
ncbi:hypothetical protein EYF80_059266 [Liparis tanakae]|uniref:Uncharacterized protein n=1 Tax=Liparis tanakae TaxID=230148 RepID=A0A4Z2EPV3_9TELE|nr:hypothetical protein EYF80_059266 [Liparis tanakae]